MKLYLIRHAQVKSNLRSIAYNDLDEGLTEEGRKQAKKLTKRLAKINIDKIFISKTRRAYQTILPLLKLKSLPTKQEKDLNDCNYGIFGGLTIEEAKKKYPDIFRKRERDKYNIKIPEGESFRNVAHRLDRFLSRLKKDVKKNQYRNILVITHATNLKVFLIKYLAFSIKRADSIHFRTTSISSFELKDGRFKPIKINDSSHIKDVSSYKDKRIHTR